MTRLALWKAGARMFGDHLFTGTGAGTFVIVYGESYINRKVGDNTWRAAHNSYIQIAAELGIFGLMIWLSILASGFLSLWLSPITPIVWPRSPSRRNSLARTIPRLEFSSACFTYKFHGRGSIPLTRLRPALDVAVGIDCRVIA